MIDSIINRLYVCVYIDQYKWFLSKWVLRILLYYPNPNYWHQSIVEREHPGDLCIPMYLNFETLQYAKLTSPDFMIIVEDNLANSRHIISTGIWSPWILTPSIWLSSACGNSTVTCGNLVHNFGMCWAIICAWNLCGISKTRDFLFLSCEIRLRSSERHFCTASFGPYIVAKFESESLGGT